eukprot:6201235-Pleurochrysis_carterae.AAC.1
MGGTPMAHNARRLRRRPSVPNVYCLPVHLCCQAGIAMAYGEWWAGRISRSHVRPVATPLCAHAIIGARLRTYWRSASGFESQEGVAYPAPPCTSDGSLREQARYHDSTRLLGRSTASLWLLGAPLYEIELGVMTRISPAPTLLCLTPEAMMCAHCDLEGGR